ncbi:MAG TPA: thiamine biosynthesis protein ThiF, partial [Flavobacterium sp.]|nr:thiamine biosynthesis protein ThiF [Flavobacterium sp.]
KLLKAKVLIIGMGGLGSAVLPYLVAAGVGKIGIIDNDTIDESNLQRQVIYKTQSVGESKVLQAKKMALDLNPFVEINAITEKLSPENAISLFSQYDIMVDATDNLETKYLINDACCVTKKPFVYGSVYKFEGQVSVFNYQNGPNYSCLFSEQNTRGQNCNETGVLGISVGIIGMFQANEVLKMILGIGDVLSGKVLVYNFLNNEQQKIEFSQTKKSIMNKHLFESKYESKKHQEIELAEALKEKDHSDVLFLDVRNYDEYPKISFQNCIHIPLHNLEKSLHQLDPHKKIFIFCQSGIRSKKAIEILNKHHFNKTTTIKGGAESLANYE